MTSTKTTYNTVEQHNHKINQEIRNLELFKFRKHNTIHDQRQIQLVIDHLKKKLIA